MRIVLASSEAVPFSKTGGLADVATALPKALSLVGHDVSLITPYYPQVLKKQGTTFLQSNQPGYPCKLASARKRSKAESCDQPCRVRESTCF